MADLAYCTAADVEALAGELAVELRLDDFAPGEAAAFMAEAIDFASGRIDFFCSRYAQAELAANRWVKGVATLIALKKLASRRMNDVPKALVEEWEERQKELDQVRKGEAEVPRAATSRRPATVSSPHVDLRRANNQVRVDTARSTGVSVGYPRPTDPTAPNRR